MQPIIKRYSYLAKGVIGGPVYFYPGPKFSLDGAVDKQMIFIIQYKLREVVGIIRIEGMQLKIGYLKYLLIETK